jgi:hypothetical protein
MYGTTEKTTEPVFLAVPSSISGVSGPGRRRDRASWTILRGRFRSKRPFGAPKGLLFTKKERSRDVLLGFDPLMWRFGAFYGAELAMLPNAHRPFPGD